MKAIKKPIEVEVWQIPAEEIDDESALPSWIADAFDDGKITVFINVETNQNEYVEIETLEGDMEGSVGDYIIKGVKGEIYPCRKDIFEETYEVVND